jgi:NAD(P)-dependent dehydrogenase (short-subunit alcohol dehydrogenase family)
MMRDLKGKTAVITGAGSGIGRGTALALARAGANIVAADVNAGRARATQADVIALGSQAVGVTCDVGVENDLQALRRAALDRFGHIDILMNNVGIVFSGRFSDTTMDHWRRAIEINFLAMVRAIQLMIPDIKKQTEGHIVNVASTAALYPYNADRMAYNATKAAVISLSEGLSLDLGSHNIGVTCLCPGPVATNIREQITMVTEGQKIASPDLPLLQPEEVGEMVRSAIQNGVFFLPTNKEVFAIVAERWQGVDKFLDKARKRLKEVLAES